MSGSGAGNTMRERVGSRRERLVLRVLLNMNRWVLTAALTIGMFVGLVLLGVLDVIPVRTSIAQGGSAKTIFRTFVSALITGVTLVVTISQLVLSQETGPLGDQRNRMSGAMDFRDDVEGFFGTTSPPEPNAFLQLLVEAARDRAERLDDLVSDIENDDLQDDFSQFVESIIGNADAVSNELEDTQFGGYDVVRSALDFNYAIKIYRGRQLRDSYADSLDEGTQEAIDDVLDVLQFFGPAREHIKTLYFQWAFVDLSRSILYMAVVALGVSAGLFVYLDPGSFPGATLGVDNLVWVFSGGIALASSPFFLLVAYILRIATIAKRTLAIGPFVLRESDREQ
jgi:hypothetical protein